MVEMESKIPLILGLLFFVIGNTLMNCRNDLTKFSFGKHDYGG